MALGAAGEDRDPEGPHGSHGALSAYPARTGAMAHSAPAQPARGPARVGDSLAGGSLPSQAPPSLARAV
jgi:hypothetical protein